MPVEKVADTASTSSSTELPMQGHRYYSKDFASREWENMWTKVWLVAAHEQDIPEAGDFVVEQFGPESVLIVRQSDGAIKAFYNICQHRGNKLVQVADGSMPAFTCPYHSWKFAIDGALADLPDAHDYPGGDPCGKIHLAQMKCEVFNGFIWINMDPESESLKDYLGPIWDEWSHFPIARMRRYVAKSVQVDVNWKIVQDNFNESYHVQILHPEAIPFMEVDHRDMRVSLYPKGHTLASFNAYTPSKRISHLPVDAWLSKRLGELGLNPAEFSDSPQEARAAVQKQFRKTAPAQGYDYLDGLRDDQLTDFQHYTVFPNFSASITIDGLQFLRIRSHQTDPEKCYLDHFWYGFSPEGMTGNILTTDGEVDRDAHVPRQQYVYGEQSSGWQVDQDLSQALTQQQGVRSRAYKGARLMGQEDRLLHYTRELDLYVEGKR